MESFEVFWKRSAENELRQIDRQYVSRILKVVEDLCQDPFPENCRKLRGSKSSYRIRIGDYRVIYQVDSKNKTVTIFHVRHRQDAYNRWMR